MSMLAEKAIAETVALSMIWNAMELMWRQCIIIIEKNIGTILQLYCNDWKKYITRVFIIDAGVRLSR